MKQGDTSLIFKKSEVAGTLINEAVFLFFDQASPVIIEVLTGSALGILRPLAERENIESPLFDNPCVASKKDWADFLKKPYNYCKHADKDPDELLKYSDKAISHLLYDACYLSVSLGACKKFTDDMSPAGARLFMGWFRLKYPQFFTSQQKIPAEFTDCIDPDNFKEWAESACVFRQTPYAEGYKGIAFQAKRAIPVI